MFEFGLLLSEQHLLIITLEADSDPQIKKISFEDFESDKLDILFIADLEESLLGQLEPYMYQFPIMPMSKTDITEDNFKQLTFSQAENLHTQIMESWILNNNISLIEELYPVVENLQQLWHKERITFFEEFWFLIKRNLGVKELTIIFNDIEKSENPNIKDKLIQSKLHGFNSPHFEKGAELEEKLMDHYKANFNSHLELLEFKQDKNELVLTAQLNNSPILMMAKAKNVNQLQLTLLKTLIEGISKS